MTISSILLDTTIDVVDTDSGVLTFNSLIGDGTIPEDDGITNTVAIFDKLSGIIALETEPEVTNSTALFDKLGGEPIVIQDPLRYEQSIQMTGPEVVQDNIINNVNNWVSAPDVGIWAAKSLFDQHSPYTLEGTVYIFHAHFIKELRRQWSGIVEGDGYFSPMEKNLYDQFILYVNSEVYDLELEPILSELDFWLTEEIQNNLHPEITREYVEDHPWMKIFTRTA